jgi:uncharacterized membrane protein
MSSDSNGAVGRATTAAELASAAAMADGEVVEGVAGAAQTDDPWFAPGPKKAPSPDIADDQADPATVEWFLRTGRAGLHPDAAPSYDDDAAGDSSADHHEVRVTAAGAPPWAGESANASAASPPPWETGPWPGPGGPRSPSSRGDGDMQSAAAAFSSAAALAGALRNGAAVADAGASSALWPARTVMTVGLIPLVVPGLVIGFLSLRQGGGQAIRKASWLAIGASLAWAVIIIVIVANVFGGGASSCGGYPAAVHQAYEKALTDLSNNAPVATQGADLDSAASQANAFAAATGQIGVRTALFKMANDMAQARADVMAGRPIPAPLRQHLTDDGVVPAGSCGS